MDIVNKETIWKTEAGWSRICPKCSSVIEYSGNQSKYKCLSSYKKQRTCRSCADKLLSINRMGEGHPMYGKHHTIETKEKFSKIRKGRNCFWLKGKPRSEEIKEKISSSSIGKIMSDSFKEKCRIRRQNEIKLMGGGVIYNPIACDYINKLNSTYGFNFQHAMNGGEISICGYWVDGYDKDKNIIFEYDEKQHLSPSHKNKDLIKQKNIINNINPKMFIRYDEKNNRLYDVITNTNVSTI